LDNDALRRALEGDFSPLSSPESPFIDRQSISRAVEQELKAACKSLVEKTGNAHHNSNEDAIVNFATLQRAAKHKATAKKTEESSVARPLTSKSDVISSVSKLDKVKASTTVRAKVLGKSPDSTSHPASEPHDTSKAREGKASTSQTEHAHEQAGSIPQSKRPQFPVRKDSLSNRKHAQLRKKAVVETEEIILPPPITERPASRPSDESDESCDSPISTSPERLAHSTSTALTSVAMTPSARGIQKPSHPTPLDPKAIQAAVAKADRKVAEMMKLAASSTELDKIQPLKSNNEGMTKPANEDTTNLALIQPVTPEKSFKSGLKDFVRNRSRSRSRSREPSSLSRTASTIQNWRQQGWGLRRKQSTASLGDMAENAERRIGDSPDQKADLDLNRALPPLPSLSTYKECNSGVEKAPEKTASGDKAKSTETIVRINNATRPKTSAATYSSTFQASEQVSRPIRERSLSVKGRRPSVTVNTSIPAPRKISIAESKASSQDSCFSPSGTDCDTPKQSVDNSKITATAQPQCVDGVKQKPQQQQIGQQFPLRKDSVAASAGQKSQPTSGHASRPPSRSAIKNTPSARYTFIPHQRTPSQPILYSRSAASSMVNLPPRPSTRDASSAPTRSRLPSLGQLQAGSGNCPPLPVNFSRKIANDGESRPATSAGLNLYSSDGITALPQVPKKGLGLRRMFSSLSLRKGKNKETSWLDAERQ